MKRFITAFLVSLALAPTAFSNELIKGGISNNDINVFSEKKFFGLQTKDGTQITPAQYQKLVRLGDYAWIAQRKNKYGLISNNGEILVPIKYRHTDRMTGKFAKFGNDNDYSVYNEYGENILPHEYTSVNMLFGGMFLTKKDYKYGIADYTGKIILENKFDDIYMPKPNILRIQYNGQWYEIEQLSGGEFIMPEDVKNIKENDNFKVTAFIKDPVAASGYSAVTFTDYLIKVFSSISPSHEETIDELMLSQGADTVSIFMKLTWLPKYPHTFVKHYYRNLRTPNNGPLSNVKQELKQKMQ